MDKENLNELMKQTALQIRDMLTGFKTGEVAEIIYDALQGENANVPFEVAAMKVRAMGSSELMKDVTDKLGDFYDADKDNRAVFCLIMDKSTEHINGCVLGERSNIMSGINHCLERDDNLLLDVAHVVQTVMLEGATKALKELKEQFKE